MNIAELKFLLPEIMVLVLACVVLMVDLYGKDREKQSCYMIAQLGMIGIGIYLTGQLGGSKKILFNGTYVVDDLAIILKIGILAISALALVYARVYIKGRRFLRGEYFVLSVFAVLGMIVMVSAAHLLTLYLGLELLSLTLYAMIAMERDNRLGSEAAVKYFVTGAIASGFLLYGMSLLYGVTGHLQLAGIQQALSVESELSWLAGFASAFIIAGIAFKIGLVPFHMWLPDVYHGAPTSVTAFIASAPKIATFGLVIRIFAEGLVSLSDQWRDILLVSALMSIALGNIIAVAQTNFKRLLAYSSIAHMGYFSLGLYVGNATGYAASMYYIFIYAFMTLAGFGVLIFMSRLGYECETLDDFKGLARRYPWYAFMLSFVMISMAGIPPFLGFWPKLEIFRSLVVGGHSGIAIFAILFSVIGLYYYLRVVKTVFFDEPEQTFQFIQSRSIRFAITFNCLALLLIGFVPDSLYQFCVLAFQ